MRMSDCVARMRPRSVGLALGLDCREYLLERSILRRLVDAPPRFDNFLQPGMVRWGETPDSLTEEPEVVVSLMHPERQLRHPVTGTLYTVIRQEWPYSLLVRDAEVDRFPHAAGEDAFLGWSPTEGWLSWDTFYPALRDDGLLSTHGAKVGIDIGQDGGAVLLEAAVRLEGTTSRELVFRLNGEELGRQRVGVGKEFTPFALRLTRRPGANIFEMELSPSGGISSTGPALLPKTGRQEVFIGLPRRCANESSPGPSAPTPLPPAAVRLVTEPGFRVHVVPTARPSARAA